MEEKIAEQQQIIANLKQQVAAYKIKEEIHAAATAGGAFSAEQVHAYLSPKATCENDKVFIQIEGEKLTQSPG